MDRSSFAFRLVRFVIKACLKLYFRRLEVTGLDNVPCEGAVLFCGNHQNSLIDPMMIICFSGRDVRFAAADVLFENLFLRFFLTQLQVVPVQRRQDHGDGPVNNEDAFGALFGVLKRGGAMGIFPEGLSHRDSELSKFKTGPARLAIGAHAQSPNTPVFIVPCGLYYTNPNRFRSSALLHFGQPIPVNEPLVTRWRADEVSAVRALTSTLRDAVTDLTVTGQDWDTLRLLDAARRLYQPPGISLSDRVQLAHRFSQVFHQVSDQTDVQTVLFRVENYESLLRDLDLRDRDVKSFETPRIRLLAATRLAVSTALLTPPALLGLPIHAPLLLLTRWGGKRLSPREDTVATTKVMMGLGLTGLLYGASAVTAGVFFGWVHLTWFWAGLLISGRCFIGWLSRLRTLAKLSKLGVTRLVFGKGLLARLVAERAELVTEIDQLVTKYIPNDVERMYPPVAERSSQR